MASQAGLSLTWSKTPKTGFLMTRLNYQIELQSAGRRLVILTSLLYLVDKMPIIEPPRDKTNNVAVRPAKTQISLGIRPIWSESLLSAWRNLWSLATHWAHRENSDQTGRMIWVFGGRTVILLVLSWGGSINLFEVEKGQFIVEKQPIVSGFLFHLH